MPSTREIDHINKAHSTYERDARFEHALRDAYQAAEAAVLGMVENPRAFDCGFAWATTHDPAFNRWCAKRAKDIAGASEPARDRNFYGTKHWQSGRLFWSPAHAPVQAIGIHEAGARAFRDSLAHALQIRVETGSRLD
jgi:hypothetical protein